MMWKKTRPYDQRLEKAPDNVGASIDLEAYRYALDLCDDPALAWEVASRFSKSREAREQTLTELAFKQS